MTRSRRAVAAIVTGSYLVNWPAIFGGGLAGASIDRSHGEHWDLDGLLGFYYGAITGLVVTHVAWAILAWRILRRRGRASRSDAAVVIVAAPASVIAGMVVAGLSGFGDGSMLAAMIVASAGGTAGVAWWATEPDPSLEPGAR